MLATLRHRAPNTYYGQWPRGKAAICCIESRSIAHKGLAARAKFAALAARGHDFLGNRSSARGKFTVAQK
jgi:hypothetical protein